MHEIRVHRRILAKIIAAAGRFDLDNLRTHVG
jgi:hypothetical protein